MKWKRWMIAVGLSCILSLFLGISAEVASSGATMETAVQLAIDSSARSGTIKEETMEEYWYKFTVPANIGNRWVVISCTNNASEDSMDFSLTDEDGSPVESGTVEAKETYRLFCKVSDSGISSSANYEYVVEPGKMYYLQMTGSFSSNTSIGFTVRLTSTADDNWGTVEKAEEVPLNAKKTGTLELTNDRDYFKFPTEDERTYTVTVSTIYNCEIKVLDEYESEQNSLSANEDGRFSDSMEFTGNGEPFYLCFEGVGIDSGKDKTTYEFVISQGPVDPESLDPGTDPGSTSLPAGLETVEPVDPWGLSSESPDATANPYGTPSSAKTPAPAVSFTPVPGTMGIGTVKKVGQAEYQVTGITSTGGNVTVNRIGNANTKSITIPSKVVIQGVSYKVTRISEKAFLGMRKLTSVTIGSNVTSIGARAFEGCRSLEFLVIPKNVKTISRRAFVSCRKLHYFIVKSTKITAVGSNAFLGTYNTMKIKVPKKKLSAYKKLFRKKGTLSDGVAFITSPKTIRYKGVNY